MVFLGRLVKWGLRMIVEYNGSVRRAGEESIASSSPTKTARFVTSLRAARASTGCSESEMDWVFTDGDVAKLLEVVYW